MNENLAESLVGTHWRSLRISRDMTAGQLAEGLKALPQDATLILWDCLDPSYKKHDEFIIPVKMNG